MKKVFRSLSLLAIAGATLASVSSCSVFGETYSYEYDKETKGYAVLGLKNYTDNDLEIPSKHKGKKVTKIADNAFNGWNFIKSIKLPSSIKAIGSNAFNDCDSLKKMSIPNKVETIGDYAFANCDNLEKINVPNNLVYFGDYVFDGDEKLATTNDSGAEYLDSILIDAKSVTGEFTVKEGTKYIGSNAFANNTKVTKVDLGDNIYSISGSAFKGVNLQDANIIIPKSVVLIGSEAFYGTRKTSIELENSTNKIIIKDFAFAKSTALKNVSIKGDVEVGKGAFSGDTQLETVSVEGKANFGAQSFSAYSDPDDSSINYGNDTKLKAVTVTDELVIGEKAFSGTSGLETFVAPKITEIGVSAFEKTNIASFTIPQTTTVFGEKAFAEASKLSEVVFQNVGFEEISSEAFNKCSSLTSIDFKDSGIKTIDYKAFNECTALENITLPNTLESIGTESFSKTGLKSIDFSKCTNFETINSKAFKDCQELSSVTFNDALYTIGQEAFGDCTKLNNVVLKDNTTNLGIGSFSGCTSLTNITLSPRMVNLSGQLFRNCDSLTDVKFGTLENELPADLIRIGSSVFQNCTSLESFKFNDRVVTLGSNVFDGCTSLVSVHLPEGFDNVPAYTFRNCSNLNSVNISNAILVIGRNAFEGCSSLTSITIPEEGIITIEEYAFSEAGLTSISLPETINEIGAFAFNECTSLASINIPDSLNVIGSQAFYHINDNAYVTEGAGKYLGNSVNKKLILVSMDSSATSLTIDNETKIIYSGAIKGNSNISSVIIPGNVTTLASEAFENCSSLTSVEIQAPTAEEVKNGEYLMSIGASAFSGCESLTTLNISSTSIKTIENGAFNGCSSLQTVVLPDTVVEIQANAFTACASLNNVEFGNNTEIIGTQAFKDCSKIKTIDTKNVLQIGESAFSGCELLETVAFGEVSTIGDSAFADLSNLKSIDITSDELKSIGKNAFINCSSATQIQLGKYLESIGDFAFYGCATADEIIIPNICSNVGESAFANCTELKYVQIGSYVSVIGANAFENDENIVSVVFEVSTTEKVETEISVEDVVKLAEKLPYSTDVTLSDEAAIVEAYDAYQALSSTDKTSIQKDYTELYNTIIDDYQALIDLGWEKTTTHDSDNYQRNSLRVNGNAFKNCSSIENVGIEAVDGEANVAYYLGFEFVNTHPTKQDSDPDDIDLTTYANPLFYAKKLSSVSRDASDNPVYKVVDDIDMADLNISNVKTFSMAYWTGNTIKLNDSVEKIEDFAFDYADFKTITFGTYLSTLGSEVFRYSTVKEIYTSKFLYKIDFYAFDGCDLDFIVLHTNLSKISQAFTDCTIKTVYFSGSQAKWNTISNHDKGALRNAEFVFNSTGPESN